MKWYFAMSEASIDRLEHGWRGLIRVSVDSALRHTTLRPHMLYDGADSPFIDELRNRGVTIVPWRVSFYDALAVRGAGYQAVAAGAFLRVEIPEIETEDDVVLYTDCDVVFRSDPEFDSTPRLFAGAPQTSVHDYARDLNTGVMLMNVAGLRAGLPAFREFIVANLQAGWPGCDQENYRRFYAGRWESLDPKFNWKPYWGSNPKAVIMHWHGPKPMLVDKLIRDPDMVTDRAWKELYHGARAHYAQALDEWNAVAGVTREPILKLSVDEASPERVRGWVVGAQPPSPPQFLRFFVDGGLVWEGECDGLRPDVMAAGHPVSTVGFDFRMPPHPASDGPGVLTVEDRAGTTQRFLHLGQRVNEVSLQASRA
nr:hypothetical protein [uncultured Lichenicoccus sp.]